MSYPTPNGNVLKASYMLTAAPAWALSFAVAIRRIARRRRLATLAAALLLCSLPLDLSFLYYRI